MTIAPAEALAMQPEDDAPAPTTTSPLRRTLAAAVASPAPLIASCFLILVLVSAVLAPLLAPYEPSDQEVSNRLATPSWSHLAGTDELGRDVFSRLLYGARVSMRVSFIVVGLAVLVAVPVGLIIGYIAGRVDAIAMRVVDAGMSIPPIVLALAIAGVLGPGERNMIIALVLVLIPALIRLVRGQVLAIREETFIEASRSIGSTPTRIMAQRVLLNAASPLIVQVAYLLGSVLIVEAGLSFLGLGVQPPTPSWGNMLRRAYDTALFTDSWALMIPGAAIALTVLAFNEVSDAMRDSFTSAGAAVRRRRRDRRGRTSVDVRRDGSRPIGDDLLLRIDDLRVDITMGGNATTVVDGVSLDIGRGEIVGLVGESGCGKSVTAMSILQLMPSPPVRIVGGSIWFEGRDLLQLPFQGLRAVRGAEIAFVFQDPMSSLDPAFTVGDQLIEAQRLHGVGTRRSRRARAVELLQLVGIPAPEQRMDDYPHQLSGGMRQRVMIAIALANNPKLLVADEPTTALDVTVQAQILDLLRRLRDEYGLSLLLVTHDLGVVAGLCDRVAVMYAGQIIEASPVDELFAVPKHPYTVGLLRAMPQTSAVDAELATIPGTVPQMDALPPGCRFAPRCEHRIAAVCDVPLDLQRAGDGRSVRCARSDELELTVAP